jgi:drug/metabolite transporter (DMT)-like permease
METRLESPSSAAFATLAVALSAVCFGLTPLFARELQATGAGPATIALYRYVFAAALLWPLLPLAPGKRRQGALLGLAGLMMGLGWIGYLEAVKAAPVSAAGVVYMSYPLFAILFARLLLGQKLTLRALGSAALVLAAAALLLEGGALDAEAVSALLWSLPAPVTFGLIIVVLCGMTPNLTPLERMAAGLTGSTLGLAPLALGLEAETLLPGSARGWALCAGMGLVTALIPQFVYSVAAPRVGAARASSAGAFELPTMLLVGWLAFGEALGLRQVAAAALVLGAIALAPAVAPPRATLTAGATPLK